MFRHRFAMRSLALAILAGTAVAVPPAEPALRTTDGQSLTLAAPAEGATALVFCSSECPISNAYSPTLNALAAEFPDSKLKLVGVFLDPDLTTAGLAEHASEYQLKFPVANDRRGALARKLGVRVTPEAVVLDAKGEVRYRGRIDDQFAARRVKTARPMTHELRDAIAALLDGRKVAEPEVKAVGCPIPEPGPVVDDEEAPTYSNRVAAILQKNCQECHRRGQIGPFALETYQQARKRADDIAAVADGRQMPPWKPVPGFGPAFLHDRSMSRQDIDALIAWAEAGAPEGDPSKVPPVPSYRDDWKLGTPDLVIEMPEAYPIPASGADIYRCFVIPTGLTDKVEITGIEYRPGNPRVVHHIIGYVDASGEARKKDEAEPGPGYACFGGPQVEISTDLGGWAPGVEPDRLPDGIGRILPKKSDVVMQVHYHPNGKAETDRSRVGLYFAKKPIKQALHGWAAGNMDFTIPAGAKIEVKAQWEAPLDVQVVSVAPHMHLLGRDMTITAELPDGTKKDLIKIDDWDFGWQNQYYFQVPIDLPKGSVVKVVAHYDNTADNPRNPNRDQLKDVHFGEATTDEMCFGFFGLVKKGQDLTQPGQEDDMPKLLYDQRRSLFEKHKKERQKDGKDGRAD